MNHIQLTSSMLCFMLMLLVSACQTTPVTTQTFQQTTTRSANKSDTPVFDSPAWIQAVKSKKPYTGKIEIQVNPELFQKKQSKQTLTITSELNPSDFQLQAVPAGPVVFQREYLKGYPKLEETHSFSIADTHQRYTLHVERNHQSAQVEVNINGQDWIKGQDFKGKELELQHEGLLLNATNSVRVRIQGKAGSQATVTLVSGGEAGTFLQRRGKLGKSGETQASRFGRNDTNIFDPNDSNSLGGLNPYQGDLEFQSGDRTISLSMTHINQGDELQFETGVFEVAFSSESARQSFQTAYGAEVIDSIETEETKVYLLKADLKKSPVHETPALLRTYNLGVPVDITSIATLDGEFGFGHQTEVLADGSFETTVHLPNPKTFDPDQPHVIIYATPFGVAFQEF